MKCLSVCQPWATLLMLGAKVLETRSWKTGYRGPVAIHSSKKFTPTAKLLCGREPFASALLRAQVTSHEQLPPGVILGTVQLEDCLIAEHLDHQDGLTDAERDFGDFRPGRWGRRPRAQVGRGLRGGAGS